jgi:hypothetical protein
MEVTGLDNSARARPGGIEANFFDIKILGGDLQDKSFVFKDYVSGPL